MQLIRRYAAIVAAIFAISMTLSACDEAAQQGGGTQEQAPAGEQQSQ